MSSEELRKKISYVINSFEDEEYYISADELLASMGYASSRRLPMQEKTPQEFLDSYNKEVKLNEQKALIEKWRGIDLLFQLTGADLELGGQPALPLPTQERIDQNITSYLFFALELQDAPYSRTDLSDITREINKCFPIPVMLVIKHGAKISMAVIHRRPNKRESDKDVLEKVTLIKDVDINNPHRAHIEIFADLSLQEIVTKPSPPKSMEKLHEVWLSVLDLKELNKNFYKELSNWYFWAIKECTFPPEAGSDETRNPISVIRLITRLIFIWFLKEKDLVPEELFNKSKLDELLEYQDANGSTYYKAILQNLFFATLNQEMNTLQKPNNRKFRNRTNNSYGRDQNRLITTLFRYEGYFQNPQAALELFSTIPFLNGGLFECLDKEIERDGKKEIIRIDGFTDEKKNSLTVPDELFFCKKRNIDLSDIYPTKSKKDEVRGLLHILDSYKFTIEENTPVEEEVALDPELLGKVFENLLAAYNPETRSSARKATGSYYTPREIVDYMVSESLIAYLETKLDEKGKGFGKSSKPIVPTQQKLISEGKSSLQVPLGNESRLRNLLEYNHNPHQFNESEVNVLINAIDQITVLDPACGSGAFPMGMLHKLVFALSKLDENNEKWKKRQLEKAQEFEDVQAKEQSIKGIEEAFAENELNYGRKLFLIENCIYGVDIQPIAVQIAKLRLFISLVVDQKISEKKYNRGMRALPNLETKFVAANTLIGLEKPLQPGLEATEVVMMLDEKEKELKGVRHKLFLARTPDSKRNYRYKDKTIRGQIKDLLLTQGWKRESADMLANWDPFNQSNSSGFFDSEWMMGVKEGFNVIIANPPYIGEKGNEKIFQEVAKNNLGKQFYTRWMDYFYFFFHTGINLCKTDGTISFITTNYFLTATGADKLRTDLRNRTIVKQIINFNELKVFDTALGQHNSIIILQKGQDKNAFANNCITNRQGSITQEVLRRILDKKDSETIFFNVKQKDLYDGKPNYIRLNGNSISSVDPIQNILNKINNNAPTLNSFCNINQGIVSGADKVSNRHLKKYSDLNAKKGDGIYVLSKREISELDIPDYDYEKFVKPFYKNSDIKKYYTKNKNDYWVLYIRGQGKPIKLSSQLREHFEKYRVLLTAVKSNFLKNYIARAIVQKWLDNGNYFVLFNPKKEYNFILPKIIAPQRSPINTFGYNEIPWYASADVYFITEKDKTVLLKYILALLNSKLYYLWLYHRGKRKGEMLELYQKPLSEIPIKKISKPDQNLFVSVVDKILLITQDEDFQNNPTKQAEVEALEREIDQMVYHLYGLTEEEIEIVEGKR